MHYFSMEFLMGRLLVNNMMNLGIYEIVKEGLEEYELNIHDLEELESDAGLGNGGLDVWPHALWIHLLLIGLSRTWKYNSL